MALAVVFPGQGSQSVGMLARFASEHNEVKQTFDQASQVLGYDLWELTQQGPADVLNQTVHTQPALLSADYAAWKVWRKTSSDHVKMLAGHSLGEYAALVCADALSFNDAVKLVAARGQYMQEAVPVNTGAMAAIIGLDEQQVKDLCAKARLENEVLAPANYNSLEQIVIAGNQQSVNNALKMAKSCGAKLAMPIPVSVPSHCDLMRPAAERLATMLASIPFLTPQMPVISNVDVKPYTDAASIRDGLTRQLYMSVRWVNTVQYFISAGVNKILECGPGKILTGLNKRIDKELIVEYFPA